MLFFEVVQRSGFLALASAFALAAAAVVACQEPDPNWGEVNGIWGKTLPGETGSAPTGSSGEVTSLAGSLAAAHGSEAGKAGGAPTSNAKDCFACHGSTAPKFAFAGRVETGGTGVKDVIVAVTGMKSVVTDAEGYFWSLEDKVLASGSKTSIKPKTGNPREMGTPLGEGANGGNCTSTQGCHGGGQAPITP